MGDSAVKVSRCAGESAGRAAIGREPGESGESGRTECRLKSRRFRVWRTGLRGSGLADQSGSAWPFQPSSWAWRLHDMQAHPQPPLGDWVHGRRDVVCYFVVQGEELKRWWHCLVVHGLAVVGKEDCPGLCGVGGYRNPERVSCCAAYQAGSNGMVCSWSVT